jgi:5-methylcytosine-specific restriction endonuclease McrA
MLDMPERMRRFLANPPKRISAEAIKKRKSRTARRYLKNWLPSLIRQQSGCCYYCRVPITTDSFPRGKQRSATIDHYIALANGGKNDRSNLVAACYDCNRDKADRDPEEFRAAIAAGSRSKPERNRPNTV